MLPKVSGIHALAAVLPLELFWLYLWRADSVRICDLLLAGQFTHHTSILISLPVGGINKVIRDHNKAFSIADLRLSAEPFFKRAGNTRRTGSCQMNLSTFSQMISRSEMHFHPLAQSDIF
ncbi:hypothetical protein EHS86_11195 [Erwinia amylovora]|uniref:Uncharacterized protein n=2 Tax=Erwinia amylovora TaxID=552 RepID=A0A831ELC9_ERWAM|nr:hypothetical protein AD997_01875 [Erwinia amylovora]EKV52702.1 hypothetical protein EaACW_3291 [Erwinia amylovora ACW56400]CBA23343.1 hypothetical protein predicted by Glimmer/Critica [Erwinia amylovora CFBP1430]CBJ45021.1 hypothetical protein EAM_0346 [Erwinia amylovora ATCC 49946]CCO80130.1 hypothetical protein BN432_3360 [Erwinia amylovora Ea356]CCO83934.1 hypothetical protein BN433_3386 [Erwinia amylovora Ea266]CCO87697.1 hypothetical protein BN434_3337 [Erwinia amylovora CFBP 2585]CC